MDRIRAVIGRDSWLVQNFSPELSRLNWSGYKEASYPGMPLFRVLQSSGALDSFPSKWLAPTRPMIEFYDLKTDPQGLYDVSNDPAYAGALASMRRELDAWILASQDRGASGDPATEPTLEQIQKDKRADYQRTWKSRLQKPEPTDTERLAWWMKSYRLE